MITKYKGIVRNNTIVLEAGVQLPEGTEVEVRLPSGRQRLTRQQRLDKAVNRLRANPITRPIGMQEIIEENKRELEERWQFEDPSGS
jgi:hypothetical protein